ncbi:MAG TPA: hypothetical protein VK939_17915 [Longimicrobiales bacterium]|nr:hypothetical protein [Longimicrobiales bacterium]
MTASDRRTISTLVLWALAYLVARFAAELLERGSPLLLLLVILPAVPFALFLRALVASIRGADELERRIQLEALAVAFPLTLFLLMVLGLLELATELSPADWSYRHLWPFMVVFWILGQTIARRRYA